MMLVKPLAKGTLHVTEEVVAIIAEAAVNDTKGVSGTISGLRDEFARVVNKNPAKGILVDGSESEMVIQVKVSLLYGVNIKNVCHELQKRIKQNVEMMTGVAVQSVHISVVQITFQ